MSLALRVERDLKATGAGYIDINDEGHGCYVKGDLVLIYSYEVSGKIVESFTGKIFQHAEREL